MLQDDNEEFLTYLNVCQRVTLNSRTRPITRRIKDLIETADQTEAEEVYRLGKRLFFDRNGPIDVYGSEEVYSCKKTSPNEQPVDPDDPAILVKNLESSVQRVVNGCASNRAVESRHSIQPIGVPGGMPPADGHQTAGPAAR